MVATDVSGIYTITHKESGRAYVGSSSRIRRRWQAHISLLRRDVHKTCRLQRAWNKYGEAAFSFEIVDAEVPLALLAQRETEWIERHRAAAGVYNTAPVGGSTRGLKLGPRPQEVRDRIAAAHLGITPTEETRMRLREAAKQRPPIGEATRQKFVDRMTGRKMGPLSEAHRAAIGAVHKGKTISEEHRQALSRAHKGRPLSEEHRRKKSEAAKRQWERRRAAATAAE